MISDQRFRPAVNGAYLLLCLLISSAALPVALRAQTTQPTASSPEANANTTPGVPVGFVVAPSFPLGYVPASIAAGHLTSSGRLDIVTADSSTGTLRVYRGTGSGSFAPPLSYSTGTHPSAILIGDMNGDGKEDVVIASDSDFSIRIFSGNGDGTLGAHTTYTVGFAPSMIALGDFSGSNALDVVVAGQTANSMAILQNDGTGNLKSAAYLALGTTPAAVTTADLNKDGHLDLAFANLDGTVGILLGRGDGRFTALAHMKVLDGALSSIITADFNHDGQVDLAVTSVGLNKAFVLLGRGDGTFSPANTLDVGNSPVSAHVADVDGDGNPDLIVVNSGDNTFSVLRGHGDGSFEPASSFVVGNGPFGAATGDFYGNGNVDLATIDQQSQTLSVPAGKGDGTFGASRAYIAGSQPVAIASGDLNGDGKPDLVVANYCANGASCEDSGSAAVLLAGPDEAYRLSSTYPMGAGSVSIALMDVNGDKKPDLVALNRIDKTLSLRLGAGNGTFGHLITIPLSAAPIAMAQGDFNKDGNIDLAVLEDCGSAKCSQPGQVEFLFASGDGNFKSASTYPVGYSPTGIAAGATYLSGNMDVVVANRCGEDASCQSGGTAAILYGDGTGAFKPGTDLALGNSPSSIALASLKSNGVLDLVVSRSGDNTVAVLPGTGKGSFQAAVPYAAGKATGSLAIADFDGDGKPDVAVANSGDATVSVLLGNGDGTLQSAFSLPLSGRPAAVAALGGPKTGHAGLVTANGSPDSASSEPSNITVVSNLKAQPMVGAGGGTTTSTTSLALTSGANPSTVNQSLSFTSTVTGVAGAGNPTGNVVFSSDGSAISDCGGLTGLAVKAGAGVTATVTCVTSSLTASGAGHSLTANYLGDQVYDTSTSPAVKQVVNQAPTTLTIAGPSSASPVNTSVTFTATLHGTFSPNAPTTGSATISTIAFFADGSSTAISGCSASQLTVNNGVYTAQCSTNSLDATTHSISATYSGDTNFATSGTTTPASYTPTKLSGTLSTSSSVGASTTVGTSVMFTVTYAVSPVTPFAPTSPTSNVTFTINGVPSSLCAATSIGNTQQATCTTTGLSAGNYVIGASYGGDTNFNSATAPTINLTVNKAAPTVELTASSSTTPPMVNEVVTFTATVPNPGTGTLQPTGTVTFTQGSTTLCANAGLNTATPPQATCTHSFSAPVPAPGTFTATYGGDSNFSSGTPGNLSEIVNADTTTTSPGSSGPASINQAVTFTPTVTPSNPGSAVPQGAVTFTVAGTIPSGTCTSGVPLSSSGIAPSCTFTFSSAGTFNVTATFTPSNSNFAASTSSPFPQVINPGSLSISLSSGLSPSTVNQQVTFTAGITGITGTQPNGTMTFTDTSNSQTLCQVKVTNGSSSTCAAAFASAGPHAITAAFASSDGNFISGAISNPLIQTVNPTGTATVVVSQIPSSAVNEPVKFTATVTPAVAGAASPTGSVTFNSTLNSQTAVLCSSTRPVSTSGGVTTATCSAPFAAAGSYAITGIYSGDSNFVGGTSPAITQTGGATSTSVTITGPSSSPSVNQQVTYTVTIAPATTGSTTPTGTVTFMDSVSGTQICAPATVKPTSSSGGTASCSISFLQAGAHTLAATYPGDSNFAGATISSAVSVQQTSTTLTITPSANPQVATAPVTFVAIVAPSIAGGAIPTGTVTFTSTDGTLNTCSQVPLSASSGVVSASCTAAFPHTSGLANQQIGVTALYSGDKNFTSNSNAPMITQTVQDFNLVFNVAPLTTSGSTNVSNASGVFLTQGYTNSSDLFNPATITVVVTSSGGFSQTLNATCAVINASSNAPVSDPSCSLSTPTPSAATGTSFAVTVTASATAPVGAYLVTITGTGHITSTLSSTTVPLNIEILGTSPTLSLATGASGTEAATFNTSQAKSGATLSSFSCPELFDVQNQKMDSNANNALIRCSGPAGGTTVSGNVTSVSITITTSQGSQAQLQRSNTLQLAGLIGLPFLALIGWTTTRKSQRRGLFRFTWIVLLALAVSWAVACGGSFHTASSGVANGISPGNYLVQVVSTDSSGQQYYAVVPLQVNSQ